MKAESEMESEVKTCPLQPLHDFVVIESDEADTVSPGGIVIPDAAKEDKQRGTVIAVGPGRIDKDGWTVDLSVDEGDVVIFQKYGGQKITHDGREYLVVRETDIIAKVSQ